MQYIIDIIILVLLLLSVYLGYKRGFVKTVFSCLSVVCAIIAASWFGPYVGEFIRTTPVYETVGEGVEEKINDYLDEMLEEGIIQAEDLEVSLSKLPIAEGLERFGMCDGFSEIIKKALESGTINVKGVLADEICDKVMLFLADAVGVLIVFIVSLILLKLLCAVVDGVVKLPLLNSLNKILGLVAGLILGVLSIFILCMIVEILAPYVPENPIVYPGLDKDTVLYGLFLNLNPLILLLFA